MVADGEERRDARSGQAGDAARELPLVGLGWVAGLVGVAREEEEVDAVVDGVVDGVVQGGEEVEQPGADADVLGPPLVGGEVGRQRSDVLLGRGSPVGLDAYVNVGDVEEAHGFLLEVRHFGTFWDDSLVETGVPNLGDRTPSMVGGAGAAGQWAVVSGVIGRC